RCRRTSETSCRQRRTAGIRSSCRDSGMVPARRAGGDASVPADTRGTAMTEANADGSLAQYLRTLRIVNLALVMGVLTFAGVDVFLWAQGQVPVNRGMEAVSYMAAGMAV